ncbi:hypothetical protein MKEN_01213700 [Mycena kentingensis (nom. inval.)]|nr:hypothetical protein MKEN_01213700 [Mycena kentingensis (nom. inval.)]
MTAATRRRSFHLQTNPTTAIPKLQPAALTDSLLSLAQQASAFAFTFLAACAPGARQHKRAPRTLLAGKCPSPTIGDVEVKDEACTTARACIAEIEPPASSAVLSESDALGAVSIDASLEVPFEKATPEVPSFSSNGPVGLGILVPSESARQLRSLAELNHRCPSPQSASDVRSDIVLRVKAFTAARRANPPTATPPMVSPVMLDDPFASPTLSSGPQHQSSNVATLQFLAMARAHVLSVRGTQHSPTPVPRPGVPRRRPVLRQQTVFFNQPAKPTTPPKFWKPHPAGKRSCAIQIKAPKTDKENRV